MIEISTDNLTIEKLKRKDKALFLELYTDNKLMKHIATPLSAKQAVKSFSITLEKKSTLHFVITQKETNKSVGLIALNFEKQENKQADLGVMLLRRFHRKKYAFEAVQAVIEHAFNQKFVDCFTVKILKNNKPTLLLMTLLGFSELKTKGDFIYGELKRA